MKCKATVCRAWETEKGKRKRRVGSGRKTGKEEGKKGGRETPSMLNNGA